VVLERAQQFIAKIFDDACLVSRDRRLGRFRLCFAKAKNFVVASTIAARLSGSQSSRSSWA
jgi:hypothetical protein